jgi:O-antigen ligase
VSAGTANAAEASSRSPRPLTAAGVSRRPFARSLPVVPLALGVAVAAPLAVEGGFSAQSRSLFAGLMLLVIAAVYAIDERPLGKLVRSVPVLALLGLAGLAAISGAWALGSAEAAVRAGVVTGAVAAVAVAAGWVVQVHGLGWVVGVIATLAIAEALVGLGALVAQTEPYAQVIGGAWRPGGTFEYPPALAILQISALPIFVWMALTGGRVLRACGGVGALLAVAVLATAESRLALGIAFPAVVGTALLMQRHRRQPNGGTSPASGHSRRRLVAAVVAGLVVAVGVVALRGGGASSEPVSGIDHGRLGEWRVALDVIAERPLLGAGADSYARAATQAGGGETLFAHNMALEVWAELGPAGLLLVTALLGSVALLVWRLRDEPRAWLLAPAVLAFPLANLFDWTWHLAGAAAVWALALGALLAIDLERCRTPRTGEA